MVVALIVAKGTSHRLPGKNMKRFCGHPLFTWNVVLAINSHLIDKTYVSTDSKRIAGITKDMGAEVIWRDYKEPEDAPANVPYFHALNLLKPKTDDELVTMLPTSPTYFPWDMDEMILLKRKLGVSHLAPGTRQHEPQVYVKSGPYQRTLVYWKKSDEYLGAGGGCSVSDVGKYMEHYDRTEEIYELEDHPFDALQEDYYMRPLWAAIDIDYEDEFEFCEVIMEHYILKGRGMEIYYDYGSERISRPSDVAAAG